MKLVMRIVALSILLVSISEYARAQEHVIRLGTVAPEGSVWYNVLAKMKLDMEKASKGSVSVRIYHSGRQGSDSRFLHHATTLP